MASLSRTYTDSSKDLKLAAARTRYGRLRRQPPSRTTYERNERYGSTERLGSHMPLDTGFHWEWRNPINILPALLLLMLTVALVAMVWA
jgi:hypothetical protein